jgi:hypothetical protein
MSINRTRFWLIATFWIVIIASQYYFLYRKFEALNLCREQHERLDAMQGQMDKTDALIRGLKK